MDFEFSADQDAMRATVRRFFAEQAPLPYVRSTIDEPVAPRDDVWKGLCLLGAPGLLAPESLGGSGLGMIDMGVVLEEAGRAAYPGPLLSSAVGALGLALALGADDLVPPLASGDRTGTIALFEPGRRYAWRDAQTGASPDGRLTGEKVHVADGATADLLLVVTAGPAVYLVDAAADPAGLTIEPTATVDGTRKMARVGLDGTPARLLATGADAEAAVAAAVDCLRIGYAVDGVGAAARALELAVEYAKVRQQFDRPIGAFQAVQHLCADMLRAVELARAGAYYALWAAGAAEPAERHRAATMASAYAAEWLPWVGASTIQVFGGVGFTWEHDAHLYYKRLLTLPHALGGPAELLEELAGVLLDPPGPRP
jgi:alkylation response protein AidB-like acyl-CoA dehydrogenase